MQLKGLTDRVSELVGKLCCQGKVVFQYTWSLTSTFPPDENTKMAEEHILEVDALKTELAKLKQEKDAEVERLTTENACLEKVAKDYL